MQVSSTCLVSGLRRLDDGRQASRRVHVILISRRLVHHLLVPLKEWVLLYTRVLVVWLD